MVKQGQKTVLPAIAAVSGEFATEIVQRGQSDYVQLDSRWVQHHGLKPHEGARDLVLPRMVNKIGQGYPW